MNLLRLGLIALFLSGCGALGPRPYTLKVSGLCQTAPRWNVPAAPAAVTATATYSSFIDLGSKIPVVAGETIELYLESVTLTAVSGITTFDFIQALTLRAVDASATQRVDLASYTDSPSTSAPSPLSLTPQTTSDLAPLLDGKVLGVELELTATTPTVDWSADVEGCFTLVRKGETDFFGGAN